MAEIENYREKIQSFLGQLSLGQKITIGTTLLVMIIGFTLLFNWATQPDYALLFSNLDLKEADQIIESLRVQDVPYRLAAGGTSIMIPSKDVYEWRMQLASAGLPSSGSIGYEVFDKNDVGISDFVQRINYRRAIEGELARTIQYVDGVQSARVHIVIPKERLFREDQQKTTASIVLQMRGSRGLNERQIEGVANLVAASVEGLDVDQVKIVDTKGHMLSRQWDSDSMAGLSASQGDIQSRVENHLSNKAQTMLSAVLGEGKSIVRVSADLNFQRIERTSETYDPDNTAVLSEERSEESRRAADQDTGETEYFTTNYMVPRTVEHITNEVGNLKRLSVAVLVDGIRNTQTEEDGSQMMVYEPRSEEELARLAGVVKNAVGFDITRNDQFDIQNIPFETADELVDGRDVFAPAIPEIVFVILQKALPFILLIIFILIIRSKLKTMKFTPSEPGRQLRPAAAAAAQEQFVPKIEEGTSVEAVESAKLLTQISTFIDEKPSQAARLIRYWLIEE